MAAALSGVNRAKQPLTKLIASAIHSTPETASARRAQDPALEGDQPMSEGPVLYHGSKGVELVEEMHLAHLGNAVRKIERNHDHPDHGNLSAIKAIFERRQAEWDRDHPEG
jgi:hypothetical protein